MLTIIIAKPSEMGGYNNPSAAVLPAVIIAKPSEMGGYNKIFERDGIALNYSETE